VEAAKAASRSTLVLSDEAPMVVRILW
jgi:hypothetical protein